MCHLDITGVMLSAVTIMYILSGPRGKTKYHSLVFGLFLAAISLFYGIYNREWAYYLVGLGALAKAAVSYRRWSD